MTNRVRKRRVYIVFIRGDEGDNLDVFGTWQRAVDALERWGYVMETGTLNVWTRGEETAYLQIREVG